MADRDVKDLRTQTSSQEPPSRFNPQQESSWNRSLLRGGLGGIIVSWDGQQKGTVPLSSLKAFPHIVIFCEARVFPTTTKFKEVQSLHGRGKVVLNPCKIV